MSSLEKFNAFLAPRGMTRDLFAPKRDIDPSSSDPFWSSGWYASQTVSGINVSQVTALSCPPMLAAINILSEDFAKIKWRLYRRRANGGRDLVADHWLAKLFKKPNDWQTGFDFRRMLMTQLILRQNAYFVIIRNAAGRPIKFIPLNSDRVAIWEAPTGDIFYRVTPLGLHEMAELFGQPFLIPAEDICHIRGLSLNGLMGSSLIVLGKEAIALALAYEQQAARWMANGSKPSGVLQTDSKLTPDVAKRLGSDWRDAYTGLQNSGRVAVLEQGLKYQPIAFDAVEMDFLKNRAYQREEIIGMLRIPSHMMPGSQSKDSKASVEQNASDYINLCLSSYTCCFGEKLDVTLDIEDELGLELDFDYSILTKADMTSRVAMWTRAVAGGIAKPNQARNDFDWEPDESGDKLWMPANAQWAGSHVCGDLPDGGGRPAGAKNKDEIDQ